VEKLSGSICLWGDSLAKTFRELEGVSGSQVPEVAFGQSTSDWFARYDLDTCLWRTSRVSLFGEWEEYSETWPPSGSMQNGRCYRRVRWVPHIHGKECSYWHTPTVEDKGRTGPKEVEMTRRWLDGEAIPSTYVRLRSLVSAREGCTGTLNPQWVEWLMGFPPDWTGID
jgi:hypothetical protein